MYAVRFDGNVDCWDADWDGKASVGMGMGIRLRKQGGNGENRQEWDRDGKIDGMHCDASATGFNVSACNIH